MQVTVRDAGDLKAVVKALGTHADGKYLRKQLRTELVAEARPLVQKVKAAYRANPSQQSLRRRRGRGSLRAAAARATRHEVRLTGREAGVRIRTDGRRMPDQMKSLPALYEGTRRPWRHPVYGDRDTWVMQQPTPTFYPAVQPNQQHARQRVERAVEDMFRQIVRAT